MNTSNSGQQTAASEFFQAPFDLITRLTRVEERVERDDKSWFKRSGVMIGYIALIISTVTGAYTVWEKTITEPRKQNEKKIEEVRRIADRLVAINYGLVEVQAEGDIQKLAALSRAANSEKFGLLSRADRLIGELDYEFDFSEYFILASEHLRFGNTARAQVFAKRAAAASIGSESKAEALRGVAEAMMSPGEGQNVNEARDTYQQALDLATRSETYSARAVKVNIYSSWIIGETFFGDCNRAKTLYDELTEEPDLNRLATTELSFAVQYIRQQNGAQSSCDYTPNW